MNGSQCKIKDMAHVLDYRHLNLNLLCDLLSQDITVLGAVINHVTDFGEKDRISTRLQSIFSNQATGHKQMVDNSPGGKIPPKTCVTLGNETRKVILWISSVLSMLQSALIHHPEGQTLLIFVALLKKSKGWGDPS